MYQYLKNNMKVDLRGLSNWASKVKYTLDKLAKCSYAFYLDYIDDTESLLAKIWQCMVHLCADDVV